MATLSEARHRATTHSNPRSSSSQIAMAKSHAGLSYAAHSAIEKSSLCWCVAVQGSCPSKSGSWNWKPHKCLTWVVRLELKMLLATARWMDFKLLSSWLETKTMIGIRISLNISKWIFQNISINYFNSVMWSLQVLMKCCSHLLSS